MKLIRQGIKTVISALGYELLPTARFGRDAFGDIAQLLHGQSPAVIFDVGANEGQTAAEFVNHFPQAQIFSFEPFPAAYEKLMANVRPWPQVVPIPLALGTKAEVHKFYVSSYSPANSLLPTAAAAAPALLSDAMRSQSAIEVTVNTLSAYCRNNKIETIDILKTDTQGFDLEVLQGGDELLKNHQVAIIFCEVLFALLYEKQAYFKDILAYLTEREFELVGLYNPFRTPVQSLAWADALFVNRTALERRADLVAPTDDSRL